MMFMSRVALKVLDLSINYIPQIENLEAMTNLEQLNLSTNKLTRVPDLARLKNLRKLVTTFTIN